MVCVNTQTHTHHNRVFGLTFKHFVDIPTSACTFATARDSRNRARLYLISHGDGRVYYREGLSGRWSPERRQNFRSEVLRAYADSSITHFTTRHALHLN